MQASALATPSCILPGDAAAGQGGLFQGNFKAVINVDFLKKEGVTHVVNTAKDLELTYGRKFAVRAHDRGMKSIVPVENDLLISMFIPCMYVVLLSLSFVTLS